MKASIFLVFVLSIATSQGSWTDKMGTTHAGDRPSVKSEIKNYPRLGDGMSNLQREFGPPSNVTRNQVGAVWTNAPYQLEVIFKESKVVYIELWKEIAPWDDSEVSALMEANLGKEILGPIKHKNFTIYASKDRKAYMATGTKDKPLQVMNAEVFRDKFPLVIIN
jgi:hypothetical protein